MLLLLFFALFFCFTVFAIVLVRLTLFSGIGEGAARAMLAFLFELSTTLLLCFLFPAHNKISSDRLVARLKVK